MEHDHQRSILFIADSDGSVFIMNCVPSEPVLVTKIETDQRVCIRGLSRSINNGGFGLSSINKGEKNNSLT
jgi:hypothetical protein